jgi:hypothetical protein
MRLRLVRLALGVGTIALALAPSCNDPQARRITGQREATIHKWLGEFARGEREGADKVNADMREIGNLWQEDVRKTDRNGREVNKWVDDDLRRWNVRKHAYPVEIEREIRGKPESVKPTAIDMFF